VNLQHVVGLRYKKTGRRYGRADRAPGRRQAGEVSLARYFSPTADTRIKGSFLRLASQLPKAIVPRSVD